MSRKLMEHNLRPLRATDADVAMDVSDSDIQTDSRDNYGDKHSELAHDPDSDAPPSNEHTSTGAEDSEHERDMAQRISQIPFGTLKQAQDSYSRKRKRDAANFQGDDQKLKALKERLHQIKEEKERRSLGSSRDNTVKRKQTSQSKIKSDADISPGELDDDSYSSDSDSAPSEEGAPSKARASKHAPTALSSRRQVTRKRVVIDMPKRITRDPRFDAFSRSTTHPDNAEKAYSFLRDYQKSEIAELQAAIKRTKSEDEKETLRRKMVSMQNRIKAKENAEREQSVLRQHRKEEREKVAQGKTPFYLKKKELKDRALVEKFKSMKGKDRDKLVERRRKKEGQKEKKRMPQARRTMR